MGIYIKGMKMPVFEYQSWVIRKDAYGNWYMVDTNAETSDGEWHEIVPVPAHGRLIDGDELSEGCDEPHWCRWKSEIDDAPTIIPADETEEKEAE